jgi:oligo-1,6-glucosidase
VVGNHDLRRLIARFGDANADPSLVAKALAATYLLQRATPFIYQGDELGLGDTTITAVEELDDVWAKTTYRLARSKGHTEAEALAKAVAMTRDHARTPYPWTPEGGFRALLELRSKDPETWVFGAYEDLLPEHPHLFVYQRGALGLVCVNLGSKACALPVAVTQLLSGLTCLHRSGEASTSLMGAWSTQIWA